jgi:hypothetical protein
VKRLALIGTVLMFASGSAATEVDYSGNELLKYCTSGNSLETVACQAYINGIREVLSLASADAGREPCIPPSVTGAQIKDVVVRHLRENPETRHLDRAVLVMRAVRDAWCPRNPLKDTPSINR